MADFLSRIQISKSTIENLNEKCISLNFIHEQSSFILDWSKIKIETGRDTILAKALNAASSMKSLARSYFWWSGMEKEIKNITHDCEIVLYVRQNLPKSIISPWKWSKKPWTRLEIFLVNNMTAEIVINKFSEMIARFGIPKTITSDGAKCFTGDKDYRNNNNKWQKGKIIKCIGNNMYDVELNDETIWKRFNNQLLIEKSLTPLSNDILLISARKPIEIPNPIMIDKTPKPIRARKPS
ncbi:Ribonuclease H-like domain [Cinara cedri]|uniref:Ribonuclease H-like domain n=1 Tax=Cinara cedri TaxID=506608 RepID=A0A5E4LZW9_9HEMI|nr:Ribonuclease H-like domain [Cinara cedri]